MQSLTKRWQPSASYPTSMARPNTLAELVEEPFGPYWENEALSEALHSTTVKNPVVLRCLTLESGGVITGCVHCTY